MTVFVRRLVLIVSLASSFSLVASQVEANPYASCAKKKKKSKKAKASKKTKVASGKVNATEILKWRKKGMTTDEIVAKARGAGYKLTAKDKAKLAKGKAPKTLIAQLGSGGGSSARARVEEEEEDEDEVVVAKAAPRGGPKKIDLRVVSDAEIDFDTVAPPKGMPKQYEAKHLKAFRDSKNRGVDFAQADPVRADKVESKPTPKKKAGSGSNAPSVATNNSSQKRVVFKSSAE